MKVSCCSVITLFVLYIVCSQHVVLTLHSSHSDKHHSMTLYITHIYFKKHKCIKFKIANTEQQFICTGDGLYMAPELLDKSLGDISTSIDLFACVFVFFVIFLFCFVCFVLWIDMIFICLLCKLR